MATRSSTPKHEVVHYMGAVAITGISKTDATAICRAMNKGGPKVKRFSVRRVRIADKPPTTNQMVAMFAEALR